MDLQTATFAGGWMATMSSVHRGAGIKNGKGKKQLDDHWMITFDWITSQLNPAASVPGVAASVYVSS